MSEDITLILTLSLSIVISPYIAKILSLPTAATEIILGAILGTIGVIKDNDLFILIAQVGFLYLMFLAGMEVDLKEIRAHKNQPILKRAIFFVVIVGILAIAIGYIFDYNIIIIISFPLISVGLLATLSKIYGKKERWLKSAFIVGILGEIVSIIALTILDAANHSGFGIALFVKIITLVIFGLIIYLVYKFFEFLFWWFPEIKKILMPTIDIQNQNIRFSIAIFFIFIAIVKLLKLELALGAFLAGVAISAFFHQAELEDKLSSLGFGLLVPLFFIYVGSTFDLKSLLIPGVITGALKIVAIMIFIRFLGAYPLKLYIGSKDAFLVALALSMPLTLIIAVAKIGFDGGIIGIYEYYQLILASLLEVVIVMGIIKIINSLKFFQKK
ncbi:MAG: cation:proton antiporter [Epsilonproteobacteria bacterium]|nr:cation:proton antiporter [Campylobacterota bacterium]